MLSKAGVVGVSLLSKGKSTGPSPMFSVPLLIPKRVLGNGRGWLEPGSGDYLGLWSKQHCCLTGKGMGEAARSEKHSVGFLFLVSCLLEEEALGS